MSHPFKIVSASTLLLLSTGALAEPIVTFTLTLDPDAGSFELTASASQDDNAGIASYGATLLGPVTGVEHVSPASAFAQDGASVGGSAGFTLLRSANDAPVVGASQDTILPTPHLIYGFGQAAGSFEDLGLTVLAPSPTTQWDAELLIATGSFEAGTDIGIDLESFDTFVNVFIDDQSAATRSAEVRSVVQIVPEPASAALIAAGALAIGRRRRPV